MKKKITIYCINYQSYNSLENYLTTIDKAANKAKDIVELTVLVADNSIPAQSVLYHSESFSLHILQTGQNLGYFGAIRFLMERYAPVDFDFSIISNVDVLLTEDFFINLLDYKIKENIGWIAPKIYSQSLHFDFNPQAKHRYSLRKLKALRLMFKYPWLLRVKQRLLHQYHDIKNCPLGKIYAGVSLF